MPTHSFIVNGETVTVDADADERLLWVLRDLLGITGPKYSCGLGACRACTSHINGEPFNPCIVPVSDIGPDDEITTIEGLADTVEGDLHPVQQVWLDQDVAQCGFCQPGQIMAAVGLINEANAEGRLITDVDLDGLRNVCRCGTYPRIRNAIVTAQAEMLAAPPVPATPVEPATPSPSPPAAPVGNTVRPVGARLADTGGTAMLGAAAAAAATGVAIRTAGRNRPAPAADADLDANPTGSDRTDDAIDPS